jgi:hypothetical protein
MLLRHDAKKVNDIYDCNYNWISNDTGFSMNSDSAGVDSYSDDGIDVQYNIFVNAEIHWLQGRRLTYADVISISYPAEIAPDQLGDWNLILDDESWQDCFFSTLD